LFDEAINTLNNIIEKLEDLLKKL